MKLTVKNFGPIHEAKNIDVKPMTIFVGPSNTGKSYLAILIYSVMKVIRGDPELAWRYPIKEKRASFNTIDSWFDAWVNIVSTTWKESVIYYFGETGKNILNETGNLVIKIHGEDGKTILDLVNPAKNKLTIPHKEKVQSKVEDYLNSQEKKYINAVNDEDITVKLKNIPMAIIFTLFRTVMLSKEYKIGSVQTSSYYLPASRGSMVQNHSVFVRKLIESAPAIDQDTLSPMPSFTGVLSAFMANLVTIAGATDLPARTKPQKVTRIGEKMEKEILKGKIEVKANVARYPEFRYQFTRAGKKHDLPMLSTSAMVSELAPISLFIRYYIQPGDTLMIEEPEAHLHPGAQNDISDALVQLVNADVNVLMTTHSDNILEKIGNCVVRASVHGTRRNKKVHPLPKEDIAVYLFQPPKSRRSKHQNTIVKEIQLDETYGFVTQDHLDVSSALYNETVGLVKERDGNYD